MTHPVPTTIGRVLSFRTFVLKYMRALYTSCICMGIYICICKRHTYKIVVSYATPLRDVRICVYVTHDMQATRLFSTHTFYERLVRQAGNPYVLVCTHPEGIILPISYSLKRHLENLAGSRSNDQSASRFRFMPIYGKSCESTRWGKSRLDESISIA